MIPIIIFWFSIILLAHSYLLYPLIVGLLAKNKKENTLCFKKGDDLPFVSIIMSIHNEEEVIREKIESIYDSSYPPEKFELLIGSDCSTDSTNKICSSYEKIKSNFRFFPFSKRQGKPSVVNLLIEEAAAEIIIMTDAKVYFTKETIFELVKHFLNEEINMVGGNILNQKVREDGISRQEKAFMNREIEIKKNEGLIWRKTIGVYGAIYAIRKINYSKVPDGFSVDDFYITINVLCKGGAAIMEMNATTIEEVPNLLSTEFKRKVRISVGNFQNLSAFYKCLFPPWSSLSFAFFSHKVIRWLGPLLILFILSSNLFLLNEGIFYKISLIILAFFLLVPLIDLFLRKINIHVVFLRFVTHFLSMNIALLVGLIKIMMGIKTNIWQPTRR